MAGGSWKVAYADFMTAMMAFFLLMWLLNATTQTQKDGLAQYFTANATGMINEPSPVDTGPSSTPSADNLVSSPRDPEIDGTHLAIMEALQRVKVNDAPLNTIAGMTKSNLGGVMMTLTPNALFTPGTVDLAPEAYPVLKEVIDVMNKYDVYLVVRGNADKGEKTASGNLSVWDVSSARANAVVAYLIQQGVKPSRIRSIAYGDTNPLVPANMEGASQKNSRVEFTFHRPEVMATINNF